MDIVARPIRAFPRLHLWVEAVIDALPPVEQGVTDCFLYGGVMRFPLTHERLRDLDLIAGDEQTLDRLSELDDEYIYLSNPFDPDDIKVQVDVHDQVLEAVDNPTRQTAHVDFGLSMFTYSVKEETVYTHPHYFEHLVGCELKIVRSGELPCAFETFARTYKYIQRGYTLSTSDLSYLIGEYKDYEPGFLRAVGSAFTEAAADTLVTGGSVVQQGSID